MKTSNKIAIGAGVLLIGGVLLAMRPHSSPDQTAARVAKAHFKLASLSTESRRDVDYPLLDSRIRQLMTKPAMVGMAVGVVENGRITFLKGYGETLAGSGDSVTPETVFRWASTSKGVAATMVTKLAEQGKINLQAPVANYAPDLKLPAGNEYRATVGDLLSHRLGLYRNAYDNKLEEGQDPSLLRASLSELSATCLPGTCWSYQNVAYDASSEMVSRVTRLPYEQAVKRYLFNPIGMSSGSVSMAGLQSNASWAKPHSAGRRPEPIVDTYYKVPGAAGINSNIKDMALWMEAQMGEMPDVLDAKVLDTIHAPYVVTPTERGRLRKFLERARDRMVRLRLAQLRLCRAPHHRPSRRNPRLSLLHPVRSGEEERRRRAVEQRYVAAGRAGVRGDGYDLSPAVPRLARAQLETWREYPGNRNRGF